MTEETTKLLQTLLMFTIAAAIMIPTAFIMGLYMESTIPPFVEFMKEKDIDCGKCLTANGFVVNETKNMSYYFHNHPGVCAEYCVVNTI